MAVGCSTLRGEENTDNALEMAQVRFNVARPLNSPRLQPLKRPLETELCAADLAFELPCQKKFGDGHSAAKRPKLQLQQNSIEKKESEAPEKRTAGAIQLKPAEPDQPQTAHQHTNLGSLSSNCTLGDAVKAAMALFTEAFICYSLEKDRTDEDVASKFVEKWAAEHYAELKHSILTLLPWTGLEVATGGSYDVVQFQGRKLGQVDVSRSSTEHFNHFKKQLQAFRAGGERACACEAFCAVLAVIASRGEKAWMESFDVDDDLDDITKLPLCKTKRSARRKTAIREMIPKKMQEEGAGSFCESLLDPRSTHRITFFRGSAGPLPATSMTIRRMSLWDALQTMDDGGPLKGVAGTKKWISGAGRQFALQDLQFGHDEASRRARTCAQSLEPDSQLRDLLRSKKPVIVMDTLAALAPRDICKSHRLSEIVQTELARVFQEAKARGEAVVFCLGTSEPCKLAEKVYLRPPLAVHGMRCGWLRWRDSAEVPWAREFTLYDRTAVCLQMP